MAAINELISQIENPELRERIQKEVDKLSKQKKFGLVFEEHLPECTPLYDIPIRKGAKVALKTGKVNDFYIVLQITGSKATCIKQGEKESVDFDVEELVTIAEFGEPIYPYLKPIDTVCNAPDSDLWHTLIEADNYHALQLLEYLYAGKVDCIYIDPPYNKEDSKDWKYNCNYVDGNDSYRHSKWLSMMKKRLLLAKKLLNPLCSFLIVTIDEEEYLHLGCLLEDLFPEASIQMVCSKIKNGTSMRMYEFSRCNEYIYYLRIGNAVIGKEIPDSASQNIPWRPLMRSGTGSNNFRSARPNSFYPIFVDKFTGILKCVGQPILSPTMHFEDVPSIDNCVTLLPIDTEGRERVWGTSADTLRDYFKKGYARITKRNGRFGVQYITTGVIKEIEVGNLIVSGRDQYGGIIGHYNNGKSQMPQNQWDISSHNATSYGTNLLKEMIGDRFTFPKSLFAVRDCMLHAIRDNKNALVVDFFAGSGTTLHAINLLNAEDGGHRRCIMVTNNEVSEDEAKMLAEQGYHPGDPEWEKLGIAHYVTWPRTVCSIKGMDVFGDFLNGDYGIMEETYVIDIDDTVVSKKTGKPISKKIYVKEKKQLLPQLQSIKKADGFKANAAFFKLGFLDKNAVALGRQFKEMLPTLWLKAGAYGPCPEIEDDKIQKILMFPENHFAVLVEENAFSQLEQELHNYPDIDTVYIVTDYESGYCSMAKSLKVKHTYQLYRDYLDNFRLNTGRN